MLYWAGADSSPAARTRCRETRQIARVGTSLFWSTGMVRPNWYSQHPLACTCKECGEKKAITRQAGRKIGRNEKCPCGSGKKYKRCHGT